MSKIEIPEPKVVLLRGPSCSTMETAWRNDGNVVAVGGLSGNNVYIFTVFGKLLYTLRDIGAGATCLSFSNNGKYLAGGCHSNYINLWSVHEKYKVIQKIPGFSSVAFDQTGTFMLYGGNSGTVWRKHIPDSHEEAVPIYGPTKSYSTSVECLAISPSNKQIAVGVESDHVHIIGIVNGNLIRKLSNSQNILRSPRCLQYSKNGKYLMCVNRSGPLMIWDLHSEDAKGVELYSPGENSLCSHASFSLSGEVVVGFVGEKNATTSDLYFWDVESGNVLEIILGFHGNYNSATVSPSGDKVLISSNNLVLNADDDKNLKYAACILEFGRPLGRDPRLPGNFNPDMV